MAAVSQAGNHLAALAVIAIVVAVGAVIVGLVRAVQSRKRSAEQSGRDRGREA